ncbi:MAG: hypothetical protein AAFR03_12530 [Pseudomonadota bacterium]
MILRRVIEHVRLQNWTAVFLDFVIVVVGVFMGIQLGNWNEARQERSIERDTLIRLYQDIKESIAGQSRDINFLEQQLADQQVIMLSLAACEVSPRDDAVFQRGIATLGWLNPPRLYRRTIDEVIASGRTDIIRNREIAADLARIVSLVEWRGAWFRSTISTLESHSKLVERHTRYDMSRVIHNPFVANQRGGVDYNIDTLCSDPTIANAISSISYRTSERLEAYRPILDAYTDFLPLIAAELNDRWGVNNLQETANAP